MRPLYPVIQCSTSTTGISNLHSILRIMASAILRMAANVAPDSGRVRRAESFVSLMAEHDDMISRICLGYSRSRAEYDDLRQDCYVAIWQGLDRFRGDARLKTWLYRVVLNTCVTSLRVRTKTPVWVDIADYADIVDDTQERCRMIAEMHEMIATLPPLDKAIVTLWLEDNSYDEIADIVGMTRNTVATRLSRAKEKLIKKTHP